MATAYSGEVDKWRARLDYAYSDTDDTIYISCNAGFESVGWGFNISSGVSTTLNIHTATYTGSGGVYSATGATTYNIQASGDIRIAKTHETIQIALSSQTVNASGYKNGTGNCSATVTMYPKSNYTVTYNANGGSGAPSTQTKWYNETLTLSTTTPTRTGYTFQGWATSSSGSVAYASGASYTANSATTLFAVWKANTYTVTYNANGGTGAPSSQTKTYGVSLTLSSTVPTRNGYNFLGWGKSSTTTTVSYKAGASYTTNAAITLYAVWETAYIAPKITAASAYRSNSSGTATNDGTYFKASFTWSVDTTATSGNKASSLKIEYKTKSATSWTTALSTSSSNASGTTSTTKGTISTSSAYDVRFTVTDTTGGTATTTVSVPKAVYLLDIDSGGAGIGILTTAPTSGLEIGAATTVSGDFVCNGTTDFPLPVSNNWQSNFNTAPLGITYGNPSSSNAPTSSFYGNLLNVGVDKSITDGTASSAAWLQQLAFDAGGKLYLRARSNDAVWGEWKLVPTTSSSDPMLKVVKQTTTITKTSGSSTSITASSVSGYAFVCWLQPCSSGWIGALYTEHVNSASTKVWCSASTASSGTGNVDLFALYMKSI